MGYGSYCVGHYGGVEMTDTNQQVDDHIVDSDKMVLKPCPFCGGEAHMETRQSAITFSDGAYIGFGVMCDECSATSGLYFAEKPEVGIRQAADAWNRRAGDAS